MARTRTDSTEPKQLSRRVLAVITRDVTEKTPRVVWQHELPILEAIFGDGNTAQPDPKTMDEGYDPKASANMMPFNKVQDQIKRPSETASLGFVFVGDPQAEYDRLVSVYGRDKDVNVSMAEKVYGRFQEGRFAMVVGKPEVEDLPEDQLRSLAISYGYIPATHKDSSAEEKADAIAKQKALAVMPKDGLVKLAEELSITL